MRLTFLLQSHLCGTQQKVPPAVHRPYVAWGSLYPTEVGQNPIAHPICTTDQGPSSGLSTSVGISNWYIHGSKSSEAANKTGAGHLSVPEARGDAGQVAAGQLPGCCSKCIGEREELFGWIPPLLCSPSLAVR